MVERGGDDVAPPGMRVLGVDPGSVVTGYGIVERVGGSIVHVAHGTIRPPAQAPLAERLARIQRDLRAAVSQYAPDRAAVECVFVAVNPRSALVLGQARGAILATLGEAEVPVDELSAREVKQAVTGMGGAGMTLSFALAERTFSPPISQD